MTNLDQYFFQLSGTHPVLPTIEIRSILESENSPFFIKQQKKQCLILDCEEKNALNVAKRAVYCRRSAQLLVRKELINNTITEILDYIEKNVDFNNYLQPNQTYKVRVYRIGKIFKELVSISLENSIGKIIWNQTKGKCKGLMENPDITFVLLFTENEFLFGIEVFARQKGSFENRRPDLRPFFKPGTLEPRFARLMVNLAQATPGEILLDPFCGPGGILIEGALIGCNLIGSDLDNKMLKGARTNISHFSPNIKFDFLMADAKQLPFTNKIKSIATDPPYGRSTSTYGKEITNLLEGFFEDANKILIKNGVISVGMFEEIPLKDIAENAGFQVDHFEKIYIHRSLTRTIGVCRKK
ncbi:MAG TPA: THUMP domain-containing protein [candidate division Zixibacteria bacterium]|nr:THUMP domain-containing protein [candidate division Zixibacteria bacterium]